jgi:hypothetical protein
MFKLELKNIISSITIDLQSNFKFNVESENKNIRLNYNYIKNLIKKALTKTKDGMITFSELRARILGKKRPSVKDWEKYLMELIEEGELKVKNLKGH